jgi:hypothetical protein
VVVVVVVVVVQQGECGEEWEVALGKCHEEWQEPPPLEPEEGGAWGSELNPVLTRELTSTNEDLQDSLVTSHKCCQSAVRTPEQALRQLVI